MLLRDKPLKLEKSGKDPFNRMILGSWTIINHRHLLLSRPHAHLVWKIFI